MSASRPTPPTTVTSSSSTNTWPVVTTTAQQVVPSTTGSTTVGDGSQAFPTAAIVVISVLSGLVVFFIAYKIYVWDYRRRHPYDEPLPEARLQQSPAFGPSHVMGYAHKSAPSGVIGDTHWASARRASTLGLAGLMSRPPSTMLLDGSSDKELLVASGSAIDDDVSPLQSGMTSPTSAVGPFGSTSSLVHPPYGGPSMTSAQSRMSLNSARRSFQGGVRPAASSNRLSGAPHALHSRIDIVPPQPLAPPPGTVVATEKAKLDFAPSSGIGNEKEARQEEWFDNVLANRPAPDSSAFPPSSSAIAGPAARRRAHGGGPGSASTSSSMSSPQRYSSSPVPAPFAAMQAARGVGSDSPPRARTPQSTHTQSSSQSSTSSSGPPAPINTAMRPTNLTVSTNPTSPLEQLQQRFAQEAAQYRQAS